MDELPFRSFSCEGAGNDVPIELCCSELSTKLKISATEILFRPTSTTVEPMESSQGTRGGEISNELEVDGLSAEAYKDSYVSFS